jgi:hypothetical protein
MKRKGETSCPEIFRIGLLSPAPFILIINQDEWEKMNPFWEWPHSSNQTASCFPGRSEKKLKPFLINFLTIPTNWIA